MYLHVCFGPLWVSSMVDGAESRQQAEPAAAAELPIRADKAIDPLVRQSTQRCIVTRGERLHRVEEDHHVEVVPAVVIEVLQGADQPPSFKRPCVVCGDMKRYPSRSLPTPTQVEQSPAASIHCDQNSGLREKPADQSRLVHSFGGTVSFDHPPRLVGDCPQELLISWVGVLQDSEARL